jgi:hypothetical protein
MNINENADAEPPGRPSHAAGANARAFLERSLEDRLAPSMFYLSLAVLVLTAGAIQRFQSPDLSEQEIELYLSLYALLWLPFLAECAAQLWLGGGRSLRAYGRAAAICVLPPLRLSARRWSDPRQIWLPGLGWQVVDYALRRRLETAFSLPMFLIALLILPVLGVDFALKDHVRESPALAAALDIGTGLIWLAFAGEFIVMVSLADHKLRYCKEHWLDLAIILLPLIAFLRSLRLLRVARLSRAVRVFRLRGVLTRAFRALVLLEIVQRLAHRDPYRRLRSLRELLEEKELEAQDLREQIRVLEREVGQVIGERAAEPRT